jgi:predicted Zn-ribbon and HTH transcriptional regulator
METSPSCSASRAGVAAAPSAKVSAHTQSATVAKKRSILTREAWTCTCEKCAHLWISEALEPPARCPACFSRTWDGPDKRIKPRPAGS